MLKTIIEGGPYCTISSLHKKDAHETRCHSDLCTAIFEWLAEEYKFKLNIESFETFIMKNILNQLTIVIKKSIISPAMVLENLNYWDQLQNLYPVFNICMIHKKRLCNVRLTYSLSLVENHYFQVYLYGVNFTTQEVFVKTRCTVSSWTDKYFNILRI